MMDQNRCTVKEEDLLLWHYRELPEEQQNRLQEHLADCADCRSRLEGLSSTLKVFSPQELAWSPADQRRLALRVTERIGGRRKVTAGLWLSTAAAAAMLLVMVAPWRSEVNNPLPSTPASLTILAELEMLEDIEFWQTLDLLEELDLLQELEPLG